MRLLMAMLIAFQLGYRARSVPGMSSRVLVPCEARQGDPAELPPQEWPDRNVAGCHILQERPP